jgi:Holliday junction DNA helicase RuvA
MYSYISGELVAVESEYIVVDNHGIGYRLFVPTSVTYHLPKLGEQVKIYTYLNVREDAMQIFGFSTQEELSLFKLLLGVNGIGPKGALAILGVMSAEDLRFAILAEDAKAIAAAPGIGGKTAQRVIIDLKDKLDKIPSMGLSAASGAVPANRVKTDVIEAMTALGYSPSEAMRAMEGMNITEEDSLETILKEVLKKMSFL